MLRKNLCRRRTIHYSKFYVGAALLAKMDAGRGIITGSNVENASYGGTNCAERSAVFRANAEGYRVFESIAVIARGENFNCEEPTAPCGFCRQVLYEFSQVGEIDLEVLLSNTKKTKIWKTSISKLLPMAFGPKDLEIEVARYQ